MENITLGEISVFLAFIVALIGSLEFILSRLKKWFKMALNKEIEPIKEQIDNLKKENQGNELNNCTNYLVIAIEKAKNHGIMSDTEKKRFYEVLDIYVNKYKKNSYIHSEVEELKKKGIL